MARPQCDIPLVGSGFQGGVETLWCTPPKTGAQKFGIPTF
jgi:hypothetical protein